MDLIIHGAIMTLGVIMETSNAATTPRRLMQEALGPPVSGLKLGW